MAVFLILVAVLSGAIAFVSFLSQGLLISLICSSLIASSVTLLGALLVQVAIPSCKEWITALSREGRQARPSRPEA